MAFRFYKQHDAMDCGPACLRMIARHYGKELSLERLRHEARMGREGSSFAGLSEAAGKAGFKTVAARISVEQLDEQAMLPCILHWEQDHFVVLPPQRCSRQGKGSKVLIADPGKGLIRMDRTAFLKAWLNNAQEGLVLQLQPTSAFYDQEDERPAEWHQTVLYYLREHRKYFLRVVASLLAASMLQLLFPFLTQSIVDTGIRTRDLQFIYIVLAAQGMLFVARTAIEFMRNRLLLLISARINLSLLTGFWHKLLRLPLSFFDTRHAGDIRQRVEDQHQIEHFLSGSSISFLYSAIQILIFSIVLVIYSVQIAALFAAGSILYCLWVRHFMSRRRAINHARFALASGEQSATLQLIFGIQEIKLLHAEKHFRMDWEQIQERIFRLNVRSLSLNQVQQAGALFIHEGKNILITCLAAGLVLDGQLTLGAMLSIQYLIGQLNSPIEQMVAFSQSYQDAKIAVERLQEVQEAPDEEQADIPYRRELPAGRSISIKGLSFKYQSIPVLKNINLVIPQHQITAIVGASGSGKTTLLKLLLHCYKPDSGIISIGMPEAGGADLQEISPAFWRSCCGCVMQDGYIFNDTIARNIAVGAEEPDMQGLLYACRMANILSFVESLPLGFRTRIGDNGNSLSKGQRQRILIARAIYRDPKYVFLDEATNALDVANERIILERLNGFLKGRTVVVVAHRLSTVMAADKIVVLHEGSVVEEGTHDELTCRRGHYYDLVRNQLELGL